MRLGALTSDLMLYSRIEAMAAAGAASLAWSADVAGLPPAIGLDLLLVDWSQRTDALAAELAAWRAGASCRVIVFGPHTDLDAHAAARRAGLGPMWARSRLMRDLPPLLSRDA